MSYALTLEGYVELSHWELSHVLNIVGNTYMKLTMIHEMQKLYDNDARDEDFIIGAESLELHINIKELDNLIQIPNTNEYTFLDRKSLDANSFWKLFHSLHRPIVFYKTSEGYKSLYNYENSLIFSKIETNSPQSIKTIGKNISFKLLEMSLSAIVGHEVLSLVYNNQSIARIEESLDKNTQIIKHIQDDNLLLHEQNNNIIINQKRIINNQNALLEQNEEITNKQLGYLKKDDFLMIRKIEEAHSIENIQYLDFLKKQQKIIEIKYNRQFEKTPLIVQDFFKV